MNAIRKADGAAMAVGAGSEHVGQYLTFVLAGEEYGVDILRVQEIRGWSVVTPIPNTPPYVQGVLNLRGTVVPIIDLRLRLGMEKIEYGATTVIVVVNAVHDGWLRVAGLVVDGVSDVCNVSDEDARVAPHFGNSIDVSFMRGMATVREKMVILLDVDRLFGGAELAVVENAAGEAHGGASGR